MLEQQTKPLRILIVDDHEVVRLGLKALLADYPEFQVVGEAANGYQAVRLTLEKRPDVVVMDVRMPGMSGIEACREIRARCADVRVLMLTSYAEDELLTEAMRGGACGYVLKRVGSAYLLEALRAVARGETPIDPAMTSHLLSQRGRQHNEELDLVERLTDRECEILAHIAQGETNREIAAHLGLSEKTVRNYVSLLLQKLNLSNRAEAAAFAVRHGIGTRSTGYSEHQ